jgi:WD40 repeat protein
VSDGAVSAPLRPFKGLAPFEASELDTLLFFGRERESEIIRANLIAARLTILYGPSGVGKTSLLRAGVAHPLRTYDGAAVVLFSGWSNNPEEGLLAAVEEEVVRVKPGARLEPADRSLAEAIAAWTAELGTELYVILDQFEEYFLYHESGGPFAELAELVRRRDVRANFLISIREDAVAQLDAFKAQIPNLFGNSLRLDRMPRDAARRAILGPLERYNELTPPASHMDAEPELVEEILDSVAAGRIQLRPSGRGGAENGSADAGLVEAPYLQLVLERLWEVETERGSSRLRLETLRELGGAARIVEDHLERAMAGLSDEEKDAAAAMYNHLVTPSGTKIAHRTGDLARYAAVDETEANRVLTTLAQERIVRAGENGVTGPQYEIFHDVLADAVLAWRARHEADRRLEEERRNAARRHRRLLAAAVVLLLSVAVFAGIALYALSQRREARAGELVALAAAALSTDPEGSLELALDASRITHSAAVEGMLRKALIAQRTKAVLPLRGPPGVATLSMDGSRAASVRADEVQLYGGPEMTPGPTLAHPQATSASFSEDGTRVATTGGDGVARIWDVGTARLLRSISQPGAVTKATFSSDGGQILTAGEDKTARVFDVRSGARRTSFVQPSHITAASFSPQGDLIATGGSDDIARLWDTRTGKLQHELRKHVWGIADVAFSPNGKLVATGSKDGTAIVWDTDTGDLVTIHTGHRGFVSAVAFSPDGESLATASSEGLARVFAAETPTPLATLIGHAEAVTDVAFTRDGVTLVTASDDRTVRRWDPLRFPELTRVGRDSEPIAAVKFSPDGRRVLSVGQSDSARPWFALTGDPTAGRLRQSLREPGPPTAVALSDDGSTAAAAYADGTIRIVDAEDGRLRASMETGRPVKALALNPDGRLVVGGGDDGSARIWDAETGAFRRELPAHAQAVSSVVFSPDGSSIVTTSSKDRKARLSRTDDGEQVWLEPYTGDVSDADFSSDGRWVVLAGPGRAGVIDARTGERVLDLDGDDRVLTSTAFSPTGWRIATGGESGAVRTYDCRLCGGVDDLVDLAESRLAQLREAP